MKKVKPEPDPPARRYTILQAKTSFELEIAVNDLIRDGWKPHGGLQVLRSPEPFATRKDLTWIQAMTLGDVVTVQGVVTAEVPNLAKIVAEVSEGF